MSDKPAQPPVAPALELRADIEHRVRDLERRVDDVARRLEDRAREAREGLDRAAVGLAGSAEPAVPDGGTPTSD